VSHLHYALVGANVLPAFAAFYYWLPKMTRRMLGEPLGNMSALPIEPSAAELYRRTGTQLS
jgi:heme/copper-type cytochrome/quinol oxidase subunit 1